MEYLDPVVAATASPSLRRPNISRTIYRCSLCTMANIFRIRSRRSHACIVYDRSFPNRRCGVIARCPLSASYLQDVSSIPGGRFLSAIVSFASNGAVENDEDMCSGFADRTYCRSLKPRLVTFGLYPDQTMDFDHRRPDLPSTTCFTRASVCE